MGCLRHIGRFWIWFALKRYRLPMWLATGPGGSPGKYSPKNSRGVSISFAPVRQEGRTRDEPAETDRWPETNPEGETAMRFMIIIKADKNTEAGVLPDEKLLAAMGNFNEELVKAGVMLAGEGLHPSSRGARVKFSGDKR